MPGMTKISISNSDVIITPLLRRKVSKTLYCGAFTTPRVKDGVW